VQTGAAGPILSVSANPVILDTFGNGLRTVESSIIVRNAGTGTLHWRATPLDDIADNRIGVAIAPPTDPRGFSQNPICETDTAAIGVRYVALNPDPGVYNVISVQQVEACGVEPPVFIGNPVLVSITATGEAKSLD